MMTPHTTEQLMVLGSFAMHGLAPFVSKVRGGWLVTVAGQRVPKVFDTKRNAVAHADMAVRAFLRRDREA